MDEILYELREHSAGLNCGRWDYIFSFIKKLRERPAGACCPTAPRSRWTSASCAAYVQLLIQTCHRRGVHAMGGMAAQIPIKDDPAANEAALAKVRADKLREAKAGHDGTWVAHPGLVRHRHARSSTQHMTGPNQIAREARRRAGAARPTCWPCPRGTSTEAGLRHNIRVGVQYLEAWLRGTGCVPLYDLMEDAATAEISPRPGLAVDPPRRHARRRPQTVDPELLPPRCWPRSWTASAASWASAASAAAGSPRRAPSSSSSPPRPSSTSS